MENGNQLQEELRELVLGQIDMNRTMSDCEIRALIEELVTKKAHERALSFKHRRELEANLFNGIRRLDVLQELLELGGDVTEIMVNGPENIFYERNGEMHRWEKSFSSLGKLYDVIWQITGETNRKVNEAMPIVDTRLPDGSRVNIILPPVALNGPIISIRRFPKQPYTLERLVEEGALSQELKEFLIMLVRNHYNLFISGGTSSGKTTCLNAMSAYIPKDQRVVTIEDAAELQLQSVPNLVRLEARPKIDNEEEAVSIRQLMKTSLRLRPDRIILGEVRGAEIVDLWQALHSGHSGSFCTGHGNSCEDMVERLETMTLMGSNIPLEAIRRQIAGGIDVMIHLGRLRDRSRKIIEVKEVMGVTNGEVNLRELYTFKETEEREGRILGKWETINPLFHTKKQEIYHL